jgi:hypothetical protein
MRFRVNDRALHDIMAAMNAVPPAGTPPPTWADDFAFGRFNTFGRSIVTALPVVGVVGCVTIAILAFVLRAGMGGNAIAACIGLSGFATASVLLVAMTERRRQAFRRTRGQSTAERIRAFRSWLHSAWGQMVVADLARELATSGHTNVIARLFPVSPGEPIGVPFEPIAWHLCGAPGLGDDPRTSFPDEDLAQSPQHQLARRIKLHGGWLFMVALAIFTAVQIGAAIRIGRLLHPPLLLCVAMWGGVLFAPLGRGMFQSRWLVVPGGILAQGSMFRPRRRLLRRVDSTVIAFQLNRRTWGMAIANSDTVEQMIGTQAEVEFALRALASPIPTPSLESFEQLA